MQNEKLVTFTSLIANLVFLIILSLLIFFSPLRNFFFTPATERVCVVKQADGADEVVVCPE